MSEKNKAVVRRLIKEVFNAGNLELLDELASPDYVDHGPLSMQGLPPTREGWKQFVARLRAASPDIHRQIEDEIAEGDQVVIRTTTQGTHQGELMGVPGTGKKVNVTGIYVFRLADGKIVERWEQADTMGMMIQLGVIPPPGG